MASDQKVQTSVETLCEQCMSRRGTETHDCTNQAQWHDKEAITCNCCESCQDACRRAKAVPY